CARNYGSSYFDYW
nr:immunoglobulin heavy chain junction region [Mus musculus]MBK4184367.1 immunoglobulin heavy chain junction region [Mus musculus]